MTHPFFLRLALFGLIIGCAPCGLGDEATAPPASSAVDAAVPAASETTPLEARVRSARKRLSTSEAGRLVWAAIRAHGGLEGWLSRRELRFVFDYAPLKQPERALKTRNRIDVWRARARQTTMDGETHFGFDGENGWVLPPDAQLPISPRFWALTPYYFVGMPFVLADPGVRLSLEPDATLDGERYHVVRVTFTPGTGDAPDDYYVVYLSPKDRRLAALRYVVSYPGFFAAGDHSPEKLMRYGDWLTVEGFVFAQRLDTYAWDDATQAPGPKVTEVRASGYRFAPLVPEAFSIPEGAKVIAEVK